MSTARRGAGPVIAALVLIGCTSTADDEPGPGDIGSAEPSDGSIDGTFDEIVGDATGECLSLALTASQIPVVSSGPDADESALDESIAQLDMALPEELLDELATMSAVARDALTMDDAAAAARFESDEYQQAAGAVVEHLHDDCE